MKRDKDSDRRDVMKKFTFKGVLDNFRTSVVQPQRPDQEIQETLRPENFQVKRTFRHGFPFQPTAMAFDPVQQLLAIGSKCGSLRILGQPGVDIHVRHDMDGPPGSAAVLHLQFLVNEGALVSATADDLMHLWNFRQKIPQIVQSLKFQKERITCMHLPLQSKWLYVGTERGNIHVVHIESFTLSGYIINWNKAIEVSRKTHPGSIVHLSDNPLDANKLLIGFESGCVVLWDLKNKFADMRWQTNELRSIAWHYEGKQFMCSHTDGTLTTWTLKSTLKYVHISQPHGKLNKEGKPETCKSIAKVEWKASKTGEPYVIFSGGMPYDQASRTPSITVVHNKTTTVLEMEHNVIDFITICETPYISELQEPYAIIALLQNDLVIMDLQTAGFPCLENPYPMDIHESPVTCCTYLVDCPADLIPAFYSVGRAGGTKKQGFSEMNWPIIGGTWSAQSCSYSEIILTGHADGSIKFWDASAGTLQVLYKLKTAKIYEKPKIRSFDNENSDPFAIEIISLCPESRKLCVASASSHVILFTFRKHESNDEIIVLEIPIVYDLLDEDEISPDCQFPGARSSVGSSTKLDILEGENKKDILKVRSGPLRKPPGFQTQLVCLTPWNNGEPPSHITALSINSLYGLMAYGTETGLVIIDIEQKVCLLNIGTPDLYGTQDPYSRVPRSPKKGPSTTLPDTFPITFEQTEKQPRSPSIDQMGRSPETPYYSLCPCPNSTTTTTTSVEQAFEALEEDNYNKLSGAAASNRRKSSTWKSFNLKKQLTKVDIKIKNSLKEKRGSIFYSDISPEPDNIYEESSPSSDDTTIIDNNNQIINVCSKAEGYEEFPVHIQYSSKPNTNEISINQDNTFKKVDKISRPDNLNLGDDDYNNKNKNNSNDNNNDDDNYNNNNNNDDDNDEDYDVDNDNNNDDERNNDNDEFYPIPPPRLKKKNTEKRDQRLLSVPNLKHSFRCEVQSMKDFRNKDDNVISPQPSFTGNLKRRFNKLDSSFSRSRSSSMSSLENITSEAVQCLAFADSFTKKTEPTVLTPTLWVGTSLGSVLTILINFPDPDSRSSQPVVVSLVGVNIFRLKGSILTVAFLDCNGCLISNSFEPWRDDNKEKKDKTPTKTPNRMSPTLSEGQSRTAGSTTSGSGGDLISDRQYVVIVSEKQARVVALPSQTCIFRHQITEIDFVVKAEIITLKDSSCLVCYISNGHLAAFSLPSLRQLVDVDFLPLSELSFQTQSNKGIVDPMLSIWGQQLIINEDTDQIARTFCFSHRGHGLYLTSPSELQKFTFCAEFCSNLSEMIGELFLPLEMPEPPKEGFFKGLFGGGVRTIDREELFGESSGKANKSIAKHIPGTVQDMNVRVTNTTSEISRAHKLAVERGDKLSQLEDKAEKMRSEAENFSSSAHELMLKYKDKKWYQL